MSEPLYKIEWKHRTAHRNHGAGTIKLNKKDAEELAATLNRDYPNFEHKAVLSPDLPTPNHYPSHD
jgi:hypothetical protein